MKLSGDISPVLYLTPIGLVFYTLLFSVLGTVDELVEASWPLLVAFGVIILVIWVLFLQLSNVYFDTDKLYVHSTIKNKLKKQIALENITDISFWIYIIRIIYLDSRKQKRKIYTIADRKTASNELGTSESPFYEFFWGKPKNRILLLEELIKNKKH
ncbi:hypothetical protein [Prolixibacter sp. NT017]|uniref:hypothetical protein n=1 Tax=Prolixibacter sp. NT017 TaxID=2652390 RepID=UPI0012761E06|nr:hypothetical protein [Prolixibacter sp. NT017]GET26079.1 hypothetical protein NT017_24080 [Prolixibacter sp. NT017]